MTKGCENCYFNRTKFVGTKGNPKAPIVFVGESPGAQELLKGLPFEGPSGKMLMHAINTSHTLTEEDIYMTNSLQCLPAGKKTPAMLVEAVSCCRERLLEEIQAHPRKVIVAIGNGALWSLTGNTNLKITQVRGKVFESDLSEFGIVATYHPAYILRGGGDYKKFATDIGFALGICYEEESVDKGYVEPQFKVASNEQDVKDFIDETLRNTPVGATISADIETAGFNPLKHRILSFGWSYDSDNVFVIPEHLVTKELLSYKDFDLGWNHPSIETYLGAPPQRRLKWNWHNGKFDVRFLKRLNLRMTVDHDTMLMNYSLDEIRGIHDLKQISADLLGSPDYESALDTYLPNKKTSYEVIPKDVLHKYMAYDIANTHRIWYILSEQVENDEKSSRLYHETLLPASRFLLQVEQIGLFVDFDRVESNVARLEEIQDEHSFVINKWAQELMGCDINPNSWQQVSELIYGYLKLANRPKGTGEDVLKKLPEHEVVQELLKYRKAAKAKGTYVKPLADQVDGDGRVRSTYLIHGTTTGRLSSRNPNMQNQPRDPLIRGQFVAPQGYSFMEFDYSQAELRCLAWFSMDERLVDIFNSGRSIHKEVSTDLWGEDWAAAFAIGDLNDPVHQRAHDQYMRTKALNFGIVYGRQAGSIAKEFNVTKKVAQVWVDAWSDNYPTAWGFLLKCRGCVAQGKNLISPFGRRKRARAVGMDSLHKTENEFANFLLQSTASDITLHSAMTMCDTLQQRWGAQIVNLVHDSILIEYPYRGNAEEYDELPISLKDMVDYGTGIMEETPIKFGLEGVKFGVDLKLSKRWGDKMDEEDEYYEDS